MVGFQVHAHLGVGGDDGRALSRKLKFMQVVLHRQVLNVDTVHLVVRIVQHQAVAPAMSIDDGARVEGEIGLVEVALHTDVAGAVERTVHIHNAEVGGGEDEWGRLLEVVPDEDVRAAGGRDLLIIPYVDLD